MEERETKVEIKEGESASITCKARGKPPPTYSWIKASTREVWEKIVIKYTVKRHIGTYAYNNIIHCLSELRNYTAIQCRRNQRTLNIR